MTTFKDIPKDVKNHMYDFVFPDKICRTCNSSSIGVALCLKHTSCKIIQKCEDCVRKEYEKVIVRDVKNYLERYLIKKNPKTFHLSSEKKEFISRERFEIIVNSQMNEYKISRRYHHCCGGYGIMFGNYY
jgi:hypothetical protein